MPEYKRFIAYFYEYINGKKQKNAGFAKVELRSGMWRILFRLMTEMCIRDRIREITSEQLYSACRDYLYVKVTDAQKAAAALEEFLDIHDYEIQPEGEVRIFEPADSAAVTQALLEHHIGVVAIYPHRQNLEEYFLELMEEQTPSDPATKKGGRHNA